jgi:glycosyltransferase involved in cell wall biosynthesis/ATP adenylyltransferase/5',5'''-P-1,P-4-tetraphosphate phosphorylase II
MPYLNEEQAKRNIQEFQKIKEIASIVLLAKEETVEKEFMNCPILPIGNLFSTKALREIADYAAADEACNILFYTRTAPITLNEEALSKMIATMEENKEKEDEDEDDFDEDEFDEDEDDFDEDEDDFDEEDDDLEEEDDLDEREEAPSTMLYSHYYVQEGDVRKPHKQIAYQSGSYRDDFDFGPLMLIDSEALAEAIKRAPDYQYAGFYYARLGFDIDWTMPTLIEDFVYAIEESDHRRAEEKQFDYVDPKNREVQVEMEQALLRQTTYDGIHIEAGAYENLARIYADHPVNGLSVIIPVRNRVRTIGDAIRSALFQECQMPFNILIVDNHSTDGTTEVIADCAAHDPRIVHIIPKTNDLGIGGCWNLALHHKACKTLAVQLDSDDLYSDEHTLQKILEVFLRKQCAMVIGSYRMTDFNLNTIAPGVIDHREWTEREGRNNALRINGLGAPRAFYVPLLKEMKWKFPNTSYGEDYAMALRISTIYPIERIYDVIYLCRRWEGNSDAGLSLEKINENNFYKDSLRTEEAARRRKIETANDMSYPNYFGLENYFEGMMRRWPLANKNYHDLEQVQMRQCSNSLVLQHNPNRVASTKPVVDIRTTATDSCILCRDRRPEEQISLKEYSSGSLGKYEILLNPYPIFPMHFTAIYKQHRNQSFRYSIDWLVKGVEYASLNKYIFLYNGAKCGASVAEHDHFQFFMQRRMPIMQWVEAGMKQSEPMPFDSEYVKVHALTCTPYPMWVVSEENNRHMGDVFRALTAIQGVLPKEEGDEEPRFNVLAWSFSKTCKRYVIIPRSKHRPDCFYATGNAQHLVSPGAIDMGGVIILPRAEDFKTLQEDEALRILQEVALAPEEMERCIARWKEAMEF